MQIYISERVLIKVRDAFPNVLPSSRISLEDLRELQGQQQVIRFLESLNEDEKESD